jgi:hypothetical protein
MIVVAIPGDRTVRFLIVWLRPDRLPRAVVAVGMPAILRVESRVAISIPAVRIAVLAVQNSVSAGMIVASAVRIAVSAVGIAVPAVGIVFPIVSIAAVSVHDPQV